MKDCILITAYAVNPNRGSEDGTGWNIIRHLGKEHHLIAITRRNNQADIDAFWEEHGEEKEESNIDFHYYDLPQWLSFWKRGSRGALLYHYLWQLGVALFVIRKDLKFDIAHHLNFHCDWCPSFLWLCGRPVVWGPIGHHPRIPKDYLQHSFWRTRVAEQLKWRLKTLAWRLDPFLQLSKNRSAAIIGINSTVAKALRLPSERVDIIPAVAAPKRTVGTPSVPQQFRVLSVGRFVPLKGFDMCINAFARFYKQLAPADQQQVKLTLIGKGPELPKLEKLIAQTELPTHSIEILPWVPQAELWQHFAQSQLFFFPSHEGAGMVIPEAMSFSLPILCYDNCGPGETTGPKAGIRVPYSTYEQSVEDYAQVLSSLYHHPALRKQMAQAALDRFDQVLNWPAKAKQISKIYERVSVKQSLPQSAISMMASKLS